MAFSLPLKALPHAKVTESWNLKPVTLKKIKIKSVKKNVKKKQPNLPLKKKRHKDKKSKDYHWTQTQNTKKKIQNKIKEFLMSVLFYSVTL